MNVQTSLSIDMASFMTFIAYLMLIWSVFACLLGSLRFFRVRRWRKMHHNKTDLLQISKIERLFDACRNNDRVVYFDALIVGPSIRDRQISCFTAHLQFAVNRLEVSRLFFEALFFFTADHIFISHDHISWPLPETVRRRIKINVPLGSVMSKCTKTSHLKD